jgi:hypothetical protein
MDDDIPDFELFDISDVKVHYERSKDQKKVTATVKSNTPISEMKLYLILGNEVTKLERRLGISEEVAGLNH